MLHTCSRHAAWVPHKQRGRAIRCDADHAGLFYRTSSSVRLWWEFQEPKGPKGGMLLRQGRGGVRGGGAVLRTHCRIPAAAVPSADFILAEVCSGLSSVHAWVEANEATRLFGDRTTPPYLYRGASLIRNCPPPPDHHRALGIVLLKGPRGVLFLMSEVPLYRMHYGRAIRNVTVRLTPKSGRPPLLPNPLCW